MYERQNVPLNFLVQRMRIIILKKTESTTGISASRIYSLLQILYGITQQVERETIYARQNN